ncbi:MAG: hypothetical protein IIW10_02110 [Spirochaetaceae bacterium]|nr:hypothetical protein [Spirochaetaceae bacterium]
MRDPYDTTQIFDSRSSTDAFSWERAELSFFNVIFTGEEARGLCGILEELQTFDSNMRNSILEKCDVLNQLLGNINRFPSLWVDEGARNYDTLLSSLLSADSGDKLLSIPTKAFLGKGFLVAKFQMFSGILHFLRDKDALSISLNKIRSMALRVMFTIMLEDVYFSILADKNNSVELRTKVAKKLIFLWEHRCDMNAEILPEMLEKVWAIRDNIVPAFGTMVGTSELLRLMIEMPESWLDFLKTSEHDVNIKYSLEEFIFGLTYEQIGRLRNKMETMVTKVIGREDVYQELKNDQLSFEKELNPKQFYKMFSIRRDCARGRREFALDGPTHTLEDYFMRYLLENDKDLLS